MPIAISNATIVTGDRTGAVHFNSAIIIEGKRIAAIGSEATAAMESGSFETIDGTGRLVLPGFANAHTHFSLTLARGMYEDLSPPNRPPYSGGLAPLPLPEL